MAGEWEYEAADNRGFRQRRDLTGVRPYHVRVLGRIPTVKTIALRSLEPDAAFTADMVPAIPISIETLRIVPPGGTDEELAHLHVNNTPPTTAEDPTKTAALKHQQSATAALAEKTTTGSATASPPSPMKKQPGKRQRGRGRITKDHQHIPRPSRTRHLLASRACRSSIMIGKTLQMQQMQAVVRHMGELEKPWNCKNPRLRYR
ncbi:MAG: hypothetical protein LQ350_001710 [Teloschistes chrysophthalmus]|nr:MAG: hypothetical protein LQ350_001710 [Niorma chrysophthalma]